VKRALLLGALLALPPALLGLASASPLRSVAVAVPAVLALILLDRALSARFDPGAAFWITVLAAYGTAVFPLLAHAPDLRRSLALLLAAVAVGVAPRGGSWSSLRTATFASLAAAGLLVGGALAGPVAEPDVARALFGSRHGLLFWTPLLWLGFGGLAMHLRRYGRRGAPVAVLGLLPLVAAPFLPDGGRAERWDAALPALAFGMATAWDAIADRVAARPGLLFAAAVVLIALPNLLFMEQYRDAPRRDDTVRFPDVAEGNARMVAHAVGSPVAWPANWIWGASTGLPAARWDLLSGQRLDPRHGVRIEIGDLEQDAAFLQGGWSVRHACGDALCRALEGRAEILVPLERAATAAPRLLISGSGEVRVSVNGAVLGTVDGQGGDLPPASWRRGVNRVGLEGVSGTPLVDALLIPRGER
jgi:hypothetical protein